MSRRADQAMEAFSLRGQHAFVTGAGSGIGQRIAVALAAAGADVACFDLPASPGLAHTTGAIEQRGRRALAVTGDVRQAADLERAVAAAEQQLGTLEVAVNSAGIANACPAEQMGQDQWRDMLEVNLGGLFLSCQAQAKVMLARRRGAIVNIASMSGSIVNRGLLQAHYNSSKAAVIHLTKSLAMEWCARGVRVNSISPGYTATAMNKRPEVADNVKQFEADTPLGRMATVDEIAWPAVFLCTPAAAYITGADLLPIRGRFSHL